MNGKIKSLSFSRGVDIMGSASLEIALARDVELDPIITIPDLAIGKLVTINAGYKQVLGESVQGGPEPRNAFVGIVDTFGQKNTATERIVSVKVSSVFKDLHRVPPQELLYSSINRQTLMEQIIENEGHVSSAYHDFTGVVSYIYSGVTSRGASVAAVLRQIAESGEALLLETQDGKLVARPFPEQRAVDYFIEDSDCEIEHVESDIDFVNVLKVYGRKLTSDEVSGGERVVYNRVRSMFLPGYPVPTIALVCELDLSPIDTSAGVSTELFWQVPSDPGVYADIWRLEPERAFLRIWRVDNVLWSGEITVQVRITGTPTLDAWEQDLTSNQSSDQTRISSRTINEEGVRLQRQIIESAVTNEFIDSEDQAETVALHLLAVHQSRRHSFVLRGPYDPRVDVGDVLVIPYEGKLWRCWVDRLTCTYDAKSSALMSEVICGFLSEYQAEAL